MFSLYRVGVGVGVGVGVAAVVVVVVVVAAAVGVAVVAALTARQQAPQDTSEAQKHQPGPQTHQHELQTALTTPPPPTFITSSRISRRSSVHIRPGRRRHRHGRLVDLVVAVTGIIFVVLWAPCQKIYYNKLPKLPLATPLNPKTLNP